MIGLVMAWLERRRIEKAEAWLAAHPEAWLAAHPGECWPPVARPIPPPPKPPPWKDPGQALREAGVAAPGQPKCADCDHVCSPECWRLGHCPCPGQCGPQRDSCTPTA